MNEKFCILIQISLMFVPKGPIDEKRIDLDYSLAPYRQQAIVSTNDVPIHWRIYAARGRDELTFPCNTLMTFKTFVKKLKY